MSKIKEKVRRGFHISNFGMVGFNLVRALVGNIAKSNILNLVFLIYLILFVSDYSICMRKRSSGINYTGIHFLSPTTQLVDLRVRIWFEWRLGKINRLDYDLTKNVNSDAFPKQNKIAQISNEARVH